MHRAILAFLAVAVVLIALLAYRAAAPEHFEARSLIPREWPSGRNFFGMTRAVSSMMGRQ